MTDSIIIVIIVLSVLFAISPHIVDIITVLKNILGYRLSEKELTEDKDSHERNCYNEMKIGQSFINSESCKNLCKIYKKKL